MQLFPQLAKSAETRGSSGRWQCALLFPLRISVH